MEETKTGAQALGIQMQLLETQRPADFDGAFSAMKGARVGGLLVFPSPMFFDARRSIVGYAAKSRVPAVYPWREAVEVGGLMSYATNFSDMYRRAAGYVDKILKGAKA